MHKNKSRYFKNVRNGLLSSFSVYIQKDFTDGKKFRTSTYIDLEPHSIWDTLISHVRSVEVPERVNAIVAVTPEAGPVWTYTR